MRPFLIKLIVFVAIPSAIFAIAFAVKANYYKNLGSPFPSSVNTLLLGDSRIIGGLDDKNIPNSKNVARGGEHYLVSFYKLKSISEKLSLKTALIDLSYSNISYSIDFKFKTNPIYADECATGLYPILGTRMYRLPFDDMTVTKILFRNTLSFKTPGIESNIENFYAAPYVFNENENIEPVLQKHFFVGNKGDKIAPMQLQYLDSLAQWSINKDINLVIILPPLTKKYIDSVPPSIKSQFDSIIESIRRRYPKIIFVDLSKSLSNEKFSNCDHVNDVGAKVFTDTVAQILKRI